MRKVVAILVLSWFALQGAGVLRLLHDWQHAVEDARLTATAGTGGHGHRHGNHYHVHDPDPWDEGTPAEPAKAPAPSPVHDDSNCVIHLQLNAPITGAAWMPVLIALGVLVAFLTMLAPMCGSRWPAMRLACRGPPVG
ncbi:MAG: hypothetical protein ACAI43_10060 [Phycisphaerae bacterium]|nr:hypothetical protein [Tepidisphaeraceae bacterium]